GTVRIEAAGRSRPVDVAVDADIPRLHAELLRRLRTLDSSPDPV
ncbi:MAG: hypothetical protein QOC67_602, partial [Pseudonocardiales bacterium]|nr:hypothetical protein [Pseudonocardiales bacterium]